MNYHLFCFLPFAVILFLALPLLLDPGAVDRILMGNHRTPPTHPPGYENTKRKKKR